MARLLRLFERAFTAISLFFFSQALFIFFVEDPSAADKDSALLRSIFLLIYLIAFCLLALRWQKTFKIISRNKWIFFLLALAVSSTLWSAVPDVTFRKTVALVGTTLFGVYLGSSYEFGERLKIMSCTFGVSIVLSFLFGFLLPEYGVMHSDGLDGNWRGIYFHKSGLGEVMVISFMTFYFLAKTTKRWSYLFKLACLSSLVLILLAKSATSLVGAIFIYIASKALNYLSLKSKASVFLIVMFLLFLLLLTLLFTVNFNAFLESNGKDITLTGRTPLWATLWEFIKLKFWFGHGYGAFFSAQLPETQTLWRIHTWKPPHSHNGYIEIAVGLGFVGFFTFIISYLYTVGKALLHYLIYKDMMILWVLLFLLYTLIFNFTEVSFLAINQLNWVISVASISSLNSGSTFGKNVKS